MTPQPNTKIKLNELNKILNEMKQGEEAVKRLAELDNSRGLQDPADVARRMKAGQPVDKNNTQPASTLSNVPASGVLDDASIANNLKIQADKMTSEAKGLMEEASRLYKEAAKLVKAPEPVQKVKATTATRRGTKKTSKVLA